MTTEARQAAHLRNRILDALRLIDGFEAEELAELCACTVEQAEGALESLKASGSVIQEYQPMAGYVWKVVR